MNKVSKANNPFDVQMNQKWKANDSRADRGRKFTIVGFEKYPSGYYAKADYGDRETIIKLERFDRYVRCK